MYKMHMHAGAITTLFYGCAYVREIIHELKTHTSAMVWAHYAEICHTKQYYMYEGHPIKNETVSIAQ